MGRGLATRVAAALRSLRVGLSAIESIAIAGFFEVETYLPSLRQRQNSRFVCILVEMWTRGGSPLSLSVDPSTFRYSVSVLGQTWLGNGSVGLTCGGGHYSAEDGTLVASAP